MAIAVTLDFDDGIEVYRKSVEGLGFQAGHEAPGILFHMVWERPEGGFSVTDVWESQAAMDAFMNDVILTKAPDWGMTSPPRSTVVELANYLYPPS